MKQKSFFKRLCALLFSLLLLSAGMITVFAESVPTLNGGSIGGSSGGAVSSGYGVATEGDAHCNYEPF